MFSFLPVRRGLGGARLLISGLGASLLLMVLLPSPSLQAQVESTPPANREEIDRVRVLGTAFGASVAVAIGANLLLDRRRSPRRPSGRQAPHFKTVGFDQASHPLRRKLLRLLGEDRRIATRLVQQASFKYPDKSSDWCVEKVIFDLERDRGRY